MLDAFSAMSGGVLAIFGKDAFLRGDVPCRVSIQRGVQTVGSDDQVVVLRTVATIPTSVNAKRGDSLVHPDGNFTVDVPIRENGYNDRWIVLDA